MINTINYPNIKHALVPSHGLSLKEKIKIYNTIKKWAIDNDIPLFKTLTRYDEQLPTIVWDKGILDDTYKLGRKYWLDGYYIFHTTAETFIKAFEASEINTKNHIGNFIPELKNKTILEKFKVCDQCFCVGIIHPGCVCLDSKFKTIELEFEVCECCKHLINDGNPADTPFNRIQLKNNRNKK